ncbi:hypothetical protein [Photobacterium leiognathi]|uniref:hypothetical protein n=1 Tax=Photobacterium leiognathi TaxID=553611 RepID=UPI002981DD9E|nr:hypothetical protein [Photobacterium leiognathi]
MSNENKAPLTNKERQQHFKARQLESGFIRYQPLVTVCAHQRLKRLSKSHKLTMSAMFTKIISEKHDKPSPIDRHYSLGFTRIPLWIEPKTVELIATHTYKTNSEAICAWILDYPL